MLKSMKEKTKLTYYRSGVFMTLGMMGVAPGKAMANPATQADFSSIAENITTAIGGIPGMISGVSYLMGSLLGVLGIMKIKDHVENPGNTPLKDGAIRLTAGGALFALPIIFESMLGSIDDGAGHVAKQQDLQRVRFGVIDG